jgi:hypothetical protein
MPIARDFVAIVRNLNKIARTAPSRNGHSAPMPRNPDVRPALKGKSPPDILT